MNLDRFCIWVSLSFLPLLIIPQNGLLPVAILAGILALFAFVRKRYLWVLMGGICCFSYFSIFQIAKNAENQTASKSHQPIEIVKILKQQEYQTAIGKLADGQQIYLTWQAETPLLLHKKYEAELTIRPISGRSNIGNFDRQRWYFANHINGIASVRKAVLLEMEKEEISPFRTKWLDFTYQQTAQFQTQGLLLALTFGERAWLNPEHWQLFQQTATAHLIAISGLHIALAMTFGFWFAKGGQWVLLRFRALPQIGFSYLFPRLFGFAIALSYSYLAGFSAPTLRALLAMSVVLGCQFSRRHYTALQIWWRVVALLLIFDPPVILSDSFWLSILAVFSLIIWYRYFPLANFTRGKIARKWLRFIFSLLHLQLGIWLVFSPVQMFFFEGTSLFSLPTNLLIVPLYSLLLVPIILFTLLTNNVFGTWYLANSIAELSLSLLTPLSSHWLTLSLEEQGLLLSINGVILLFLYGVTQKKTWRFFIKGLCVLGGFYAILPLMKWQEPKAEWITFDVGQGLAQALIYRDTSGQKQAIFYDTGVSWGGQNTQRHSMAKLEILPYLKRNNIQVQAIFLSHDDNDHAGGMVDLLEAYPEAKLISSSQHRYKTMNKDYMPETCLAGKQWQFGDFHLTAIYPKESVLKAKNHDSCILLVKIDRLSVLFMGDTGVDQERRFAAQLGQVDFLQVAHHGSKTSTSETLLAKINPQLAIVSTGRWNPWRMPNKSVIERLENKRIPLLNTAREGMIRVKFEGESWRVETSRHRFSVWYKRYIELSSPHSK